MKRKIKVAIVDDDPIYRKVLSTYFKRFEDLMIVVNCSNGKELIKNLLKQELDVALLDVEMPVMDGRETTEYLNKNHPKIKILILTAYNDYELSNDLIKKGAHGFFIKSKELEQIVDAIRVMNNYGSYLKDLDLQKIITAKYGNKNGIVPTKIDFTKRELEIIKLICNENTNQEIADKLHISKRTVDGHRNNIFQKIKVRNVTGLVKFALYHGLIAYNE